MKQMFGNCFQQLHNTRIEKKMAWHLKTNATGPAQSGQFTTTNPELTEVLDLFNKQGQ